MATHLSSRRAFEAGLRIVVLAIGALCCAIAAGFVALFLNWWTLHPTDAAHGTSFQRFVSDPFVLVVGIQFMLWPALIGFTISLWALWRLNPLRAIPAVTFVTVLTAAVVTPALMLVAPRAALLAAIATMLWCRSQKRWRVRSVVEWGPNLLGR